MRAIGGEGARRGGKAGPVVRAWGNLTPFGREVVIGAVALFAGVTVLLATALGEIERGRVAAGPLAPMVIAVDLRALTGVPPLDLGRVISMERGEVDGWRAVGSLSADQLRALSTEVSGSPYWAAWTVSCFGGESLHGGRYQVAAVSPVNVDGTRDWGLPQLNDRWVAHGLDRTRAASDPRYAIEFAWSEVMPRQGIAAWYGKGCRV